MTSVLGIDTAWSVRNASGVALLQRVDSRWRCRAVAASQSEFLGRTRPKVGDPATPADLLAASRVLLNGAPLACVAVDMPLATCPVRARRPADDQISRRYGARKCAAHSPRPTSPGPLSDALSAGWRDLGFSLATTDTTAGTSPALLEVYPHPALLTLCGAAERLPYKIGKLSTYWPTLDMAARRAALLAVWQRIVDALAHDVDDIAAHLAPLTPAPTAAAPAFKRHEDALDALVCAWIGARYLDGRAEAVGDATAAIWLPKA